MSDVGYSALGCGFVLVLYFICFTCAYNENTDFVHIEAVNSFNLFQ